MASPRVFAVFVGTRRAVSVPPLIFPYTVVFTRQYGGLVESMPVYRNDAHLPKRCPFTETMPVWADTARRVPAGRNTNTLRWFLWADLRVIPYAILLFSIAIRLQLARMGQRPRKPQGSAPKNPEGIVKKNGFYRGRRERRERTRV